MACSNRSKKVRCSKCITVNQKGPDIAGSDNEGGLVVNTPDNGLEASPDVVYDPSKVGCSGMSGTLTTPNINVENMAEVGVGINIASGATSDPCPATPGTLWVNDNGDLMVDDNVVVGKSCSNAIQYCQDVANGAVPWEVNSKTAASNSSTTVSTGVPVVVGDYFGAPVYRAYFYGTITNSTGLAGSVWQSDTELGPLPAKATFIVKWGGAWTDASGDVRALCGHTKWSGALFTSDTWSELTILPDGNFDLTTFDGGVYYMGTFIASPAIITFFSNNMVNCPYMVWVDYVTQDFNSLVNEINCSSN